MSQIFNDITQWKIIPIDTLKLKIAAEYYSFENLDSDSSYNIQPILRANDRGAQTTTAFRLDARCFIIQNNFEDLRETLALIGNNEIEEISIRLRSVDGQSNGEQLFIKPSGNADVSSSYVHWGIDHKGPHPRLIFEAGFIVSKDAIEDTLSPMFVQSWI